MLFRMMAVAASLPFSNANNLSNEVRSDAYPLNSARRFSISALFEVGKVVRLSVLINTSKCGVSVFEKAAQET